MVTSYEKLPGYAIPVFDIDSSTKAAWVLEDTGKVTKCALWEGRSRILGAVLRMEEVGEYPRNFSGQWDKLRSASEIVCRVLADKLYGRLERYLDSLRLQASEGHTRVLVVEDSLLVSSESIVKTFSFSAAHLVQSNETPPTTYFSLTLGRLPRISPV